MFNFLRFLSYTGCVISTILSASSFFMSQIEPGKKEPKGADEFEQASIMLLGYHSALIETDRQGIISVDCSKIEFFNGIKNGSWLIFKDGMWRKHPSQHKGK